MFIGGQLLGNIKHIAVAAYTIYGMQHLQISNVHMLIEFHIL